MLSIVCYKDLLARDTKWNKNICTLKWYDMQKLFNFIIACKKERTTEVTRRIITYFVLKSKHFQKTHNRQILSKYEEPWVHYTLYNKKIYPYIPWKRYKVISSSDECVPQAMSCCNPGRIYMTALTEFLCLAITAPSQEKRTVTTGDSGSSRCSYFGSGSTVCSTFWSGLYAPSSSCKGIMRNYTFMLGTSVQYFLCKLSPWETFAIPYKCTKECTFRINSQE